MVGRKVMLALWGGGVLRLWVVCLISSTKNYVVFDNAFLVECIG